MTAFPIFPEETMAMSLSPRAVAPAVAAIAMMLATPAQAAPAASPSAASLRGAASLQDTLNLSSEQASKVDSILDNSADAAKTAEAKYDARPARLSRELASIERRRDKRLNRVLSPVQFGWFKAWEGRQMAGRLAQAIRDHVGLNEDQTSRVEAIYAKAYTALRAIPNFDGPTERERKIRAVEADRDAALRSVLSEDQFARFETSKTKLHAQSRAQILAMIG